MPYLDQSKIALPKDETNYNTWADYFELLCLLHPDRNLTVETLKDRLIDENGGDVQKALAQITGTFKRLDVLPIDLIDFDETSQGINDPETEQQIKTCIIRIIQYISARAKIIRNHYPITIGSHNQLIGVQSGNLNKNHKLYIILLLSSLIRVISRKDGFAYRITHRFEELCRFPFKQIIPQGAETVFFGAGGYISDAILPNQGAVVNGSFYNKVEQIANLLNLHTTKLFTQSNAGIYNNGDGGLDWLGYYPFNDGLSTTPTYFAQCACGNDWEDKQFDAHSDKWRLYITWLSDYQRVHFIPKSFRDEQNSWLNEISIYNCVLVDRFRLIHLLNQSPEIDNIITLYEDILEEIDTTTIIFN